MYQQDPEQGAINAAIAGVKDAINPPGVLSEAAPSTDALVGTPQGASSWPSPSTRVAWPLGLTRISADEVPEDAVQAVLPEALSGGSTVSFGETSSRVAARPARWSESVSPA